ncbi:MAG: DUF1501 domain-containing protein [Thermoguttaceae bacterium]|nr:DUF1501 domain-containing protein [Thermoguttaceae bacterium]MDW8037097.1 DUF1501 domain-containing protein [Thermoguttaceae bacterium]
MPSTYSGQSIRDNAQQHWATRAGLVDRRHFLMQLGGGLTVSMISPLAPCLAEEVLTKRLEASSTPVADTSKKERVLVVLQMTGGNDGLNTVVPYEDDVYGRSRPTLRLRSSQVHRLADGLGLHPEMKEAARLFHEGRLSIVQGVGYPNSERNHPEAMRDWQTGRVPGAHVATGWIGRVADLLVEQNPLGLPAVFVGNIEIPFTLRAKKAVVPRLVKYPDPPPMESFGNSFVQRIPRSSLPAGENPLAAFAEQSYRLACQMAEKLQRAATSTGLAAYPRFGLAQDLQVVAQLIRTDLGVRIFYVELGGGGLGGFDTHAHQAANHGALLREFSASVAAWVEDLAKDRTLDRVLLMTFSEFGRTVRENGRRGTDHGAAQPIFLVGGRIRPGLIGQHPSLDELEADAPKPHTDFRRLYRMVLQEWLGLDAKAVLGAEWPPVPIVLS